MSDDPSGYVCIKQACQIVGVSRRTIYNWIEGGKVVAKRHAGGSFRILASSLWQQDGTPPPPEDDGGLQKRGL